MNVARAGSAAWIGTLAAIMALAGLLARDGLAGQAVGPADGATAFAVGLVVAIGSWALGGSHRRPPRFATASSSGEPGPPGADREGPRFDKFTDRARKVLTLAQDEAQRFNHNYIGTEHLLLGLVREGDGVAARVLENMGVELPKVRTAVEFIIGRGDRPVVGEVGLTPRAKRVIELAIDEARRLGHNYIGTEHLLLGLVREGEGIAAGVLESLGVNLDKVRHEVIRVLSQGVTDDAAGSGPSRDTGYHMLGSDVRLGRGAMTGAGLGTLPPEDRERMERLRMAGELRWVLAGSGFRRLVIVRQAQTVQGVTVELLALEIRAAGGRCLLQWPTANPTDQAGPPSTLLVDAAMRDERGTPYQLRCDPFARGQDNGGAVECFFVPPPPAGAGELVVSIARLVPWPPPQTPSAQPPGERIEGPWEFRVTL
jgi:Clp amino terminal domain, pathogenicity island component